MTAPPTDRAAQYFDSALDVVGNTPLVRLNNVMDDARCLVLAKVEYVNPGGSVKDRPAVAMLRAAEKDGLLKPGAHHRRGDERQHRRRPRDGGGDSRLPLHSRDARQDVEGKDRPAARLRRRGRGHADQRVGRLARIVLRGRQPPRRRDSRRVSARTSCTTTENPDAHYHSTGPEIWEQTAGTITHFVAGVGTGGTISGTARYLKERNPAIRVVGADPEGSIYSGDMPQSYAVEGIGMNYLPETVDLQASSTRWCASRTASRS